MTQVSAYIPCYNSAATIKEAISSIQTQTYPVSEIFVIDDASNDRSAEIARNMGVSVIQLAENRGRGYVRALAMREARHEAVLCLDSNKALCETFVEGALPWLEKESYAGVRAHIVSTDCKDVLDRWRARHMFNEHLFNEYMIKEHVSFAVVENCTLFTSAAMVRKSVVMAVGNYREDLKHSEDRELSERLQKAAYKIGFDTRLWVKFVGPESLDKIMDRYWRWTSTETVTFSAYLKAVAFSLKVLCRKDLAAGDIRAAAISLLVPHYQYMRTLISGKHA